MARSKTPNKTRRKIPPFKDIRALVMEISDKVNEDRIFNGAATLAFYSMFAVFPGVIFLLSLVPYLPLEHVHRTLFNLVEQIWPAQAAVMFESVMREVTVEKHRGLMSFSAIIALWSASSGIYAVMQQLNVGYRTKETRPYWKMRAIALGLTLTFVALVLCAFGLILFGAFLHDWTTRAFHLSGGFAVLFVFLRWFFILALLFAGITTVYYMGPNSKHELKDTFIGSLIGTSVLVGASLVFRIYIQNFSNYTASYGSLGAVMILMLWFYLTGLAILIGGEVNAILGSRTSP
jgi:membrane protein